MVLIEAKDLKKTDLIGKSDPYAVISYNGQKEKTSVQNNTQNPEWNHAADFNFDPENSKILRYRSSLMLSLFHLQLHFLHC